MVAPLRFPADLDLTREIPECRQSAERSPIAGELCYAILLYTPPKRSRWRPRTVDAIPPLDVGKRLIWCPTLNLAAVLAECGEFNTLQLGWMKPGRAPRSWAVAISMVCGFDETARVMTGGAAL